MQQRTTENMRVLTGLIVRRVEPYIKGVSAIRLGSEERVYNIIFKIYIIAPIN